MKFLSLEENNIWPALEPDCGKYGYIYHIYG